MKIAVMGYSGAGKSTLAKKLGRLYDCPVLYLDRIQFEPGWKERNLEEAKRMAEEFLNDNQDTGWIIDGNYAKFCQERRLEEADLIVFMDYTRRICLWQAVKRYLEYRDKTRESMAEGCREKIDWDFVKWILRDGRDENHSYRSIKARYPHKTLVVRNRKQLKDSMTRLILRSRERTLG